MSLGGVQRLVHDGTEPHAAADGQRFPGGAEGGPFRGLRRRQGVLEVVGVHRQVVTLDDEVDAVVGGAARRGVGLALDVEDAARVDGAEIPTHPAARRPQVQLAAHLFQDQREQVVLHRGVVEVEDVAIHKVLVLIAVDGRPHVGPPHRGRLQPDLPAPLREELPREFLGVLRQRLERLVVQRQVVSRDVEIDGGRRAGAVDLPLEGD